MNDSSYTITKIQQLRLKNIQKIMEFIGVMIMVIFINALLPQLLLQYVYAGQELFAPPAALNIIPLVSFVLAVIYFVYVLLGNLRRGMQISKMQRAYDMQFGPTSSASTAAAPRSSSNVAQLQAAMKDLENKTERSSNGKSKTLAARKETPKATKTKKAKTARRRSK